MSWNTPQLQQQLEPKLTQAVANPVIRQAVLPLQGGRGCVPRHSVPNPGVHSRSSGSLPERLTDLLLGEGQVAGRARVAQYPLCDEAIDGSEEIEMVCPLDLK